MRRLVGVYPSYCPVCRIYSRISIGDMLAIASEAEKLNYAPFIETYGDLEIVWPCKYHKEEFLTALDELKKRQAQARNEVIGKMRTWYFDTARKIIDKFLKDPYLPKVYGLMLWVSDGEKEFAVAIRNREVLYSTEEPVPAVQQRQVVAPRIAKRLLRILSQNQGIYWDVVIEGIHINEATDGPAIDMLQKLYDIVSEGLGRPLLPSVYLLLGGSRLAEETIRYLEKNGNLIPELFFIVPATYNIRYTYTAYLNRRALSTYGVPLYGPIPAEAVVSFFEKEYAEREEEVKI